MVTPVQPEGGAGVENGAILEPVAGVFDGLVFSDKNLRYQKILIARRLALVELPTNRWPLIKALAHQRVNAVEHAPPGTSTIVTEGNGTGPTLT